MLHTPGPWFLEGETVYALQDCLFAGKPAKENRFFASVQGKAPQEELRANAVVMRAAPELLAACKTAYSLIGQQHAGPSLDVSLMLAAAIAKAEGR